MYETTDEFTADDILRRMRKHISKLTDATHLHHEEERMPGIRISHTITVASKEKQEELVNRLKGKERAYTKGKSKPKLTKGTK